jgi:hypothetical protein
VHTTDDYIVAGLPFEELLGALLLARDALDPEYDPEDDPHEVNELEAPEEDLSDAYRDYVPPPYKLY